MTFIFGLLSRKIIRLAKRQDSNYSFLFVRPDGEQLGKISKLIEAGTIRPVVDRYFSFAETSLGLS
jgi:NADPH:quinone reductase-like Zn-dependent oxidoreductase